MSTTATKKKTTTADAKHPLSPSLRSVKLAEARQALSDLDSRDGVIPPAARANMAKAVADVLGAADAIGIDNAYNLVRHQSQLLTVLTGVPKPTEFHKTSVAEGLHTYRNVTVALVAAAAHFAGAPTDAVYRDSVRLRARTHQSHRPLFDDEVLLARVHAATESLFAPTSPRASIYAMTDAGLVPGETTSVTLNDLDDPAEPTDLKAPGNQHIKGRHLPMDAFAQTVLGRRAAAALTKGTSPDSPLTYRPRKNLPGTRPRPPQRRASWTGCWPSSAWPTATSPPPASPSGGSTRSGPTRASTSRCRCPDGTAKSRCWPSCSAPPCPRRRRTWRWRSRSSEAPNQPKAATVTGGGLRPISYDSSGTSVHTRRNGSSAWTSGESRS
jgi:hypothetical protein